MSATTELVRAIRSAGLTQTDIARITGIPQSRVSRWEAGEAPGSADDALRLHELHADLKSGKQKPPEPAKPGAREAASPAASSGAETTHG